MAIALSIAEEMARRIIQESQSSEKVNVLIYDSANHERGLLRIHLWRRTILSPPGVVYARTRMPGNILNPGGVPCRSARAVHAMMNEDDTSEIPNDGARFFLVVTGDVPIHPVVEYGDAWDDAYCNVYGERLHKFRLESCDDDPDPLEFWKENTSKMAQMAWDILN